MPRPGGGNSLQELRFTVELIEDAIASKAPNKDGKR